MHFESFGCFARGELDAQCTHQSDAKFRRQFARGSLSLSLSLSLACSPVVAGHSDAVVEADAEGGAGRFNGVVALKGKREGEWKPCCSMGSNRILHRNKVC